MSSNKKPPTNEKFVRLDDTRKRLEEARRPDGTIRVTTTEAFLAAIVTLQAAQIGQQRGDLGDDVFVDGVQAHQRVQHQQ